MSKDKPGFRGVWLPKKLIQNKRLTVLDKLIVAFAEGFKQDFYASNEHIAECLGVSPKTVANRMSAMRKAGFLKGRKLKHLKSPSESSLNRERDSRDRERTFPGSGTTNDQKHELSPGQSSNLEKTGEVLYISNNKALKQSFSTASPQDRETLTLTLGETEDLMEGLGLGDREAAFVFERLEGLGWRDSAGKAFHSRKNLEAFMAGLGERIAASRPASGVKHSAAVETVSQFSKDYRMPPGAKPAPERPIDLSTPW